MHLTAAEAVASLGLPGAQAKVTRPRGPQNTCSTTVSPPAACEEFAWWILGVTSQDGAGRQAITDLHRPVKAVEVEAGDLVREVGADRGEDVDAEVVGDRHGGLR